MNTPTEDAPLLNQDHIAFLGMGVSVNAASRGPDSTPLVGRSCGCRASADGRLVTVFLSTLRTASLVEAISDTGAIAVVISQPSTHRTLQLKGTDARLAAVTDDDRDHFNAFRHAFAADLATLGYGLDFAAAIVPEVDGGLVAVRFTPTSAFDQTPGRNAGRPLKTS